MTDSIDTIVIVDNKGNTETDEPIETTKIKEIKEIPDSITTSPITQVEPITNPSKLIPNELNMSVGMESTANVFHCKAQISMDKILIITILTAAFLIKCIMDFPEFLIMLLIIVMIGSGGALYYLYPQQVTRILEKGMFMHILCASMLTSTPAITGLCC
jgi:hypothetical protein